MPGPSRLPTRFPDGTKYVVESEGAIVRRFVEFPNGRRVRLKARKALNCERAEQQTSIVPHLVDTRIFHRRVLA